MAAEATFTAGNVDIKVTDAMRKAYNELGYVLIRGVLSPEEVKHVQSAVNNPEGVIKHHMGRSDGKVVSKLSLWEHPGDDVTGILTRINKVAGTAEQLVGGDELYHYHTKLIMKEAKTGGAFNWHQDYGYWYYNTCLKPEMMSLFIPMDECTKENGCLQVMRGSHELGRLDHVTLGEQLTVDPDRLEMVRKLYTTDCVEMKPGDVLFFDCNLLHYSSRNESDKRRYVLVVAYNKKKNNPAVKHHHPSYTPLKKMPNSALLQCTNITGLDGKDFLYPDKEDTYKGRDSGIQFKNIKVH